MSSAHYENHPVPVTTITTLKPQNTKALPTSHPKISIRHPLILELPIELLELFCREYLDIVAATCFGLTCKTVFQFTEHLYPFQVNLYMRGSLPDDGRIIIDTKPKRICLGRLLTDWMAPKYAFDHSWGKFCLKRWYVNNEKAIEAKWREKESWTMIRVTRDNMGAMVAYKGHSKCRTKATTFF